MKFSQLYGVELDTVSANIARQLYQNADIRCMGFEKTDYPDGYFDLAIGNVPFGDFKISDRRYNSNNFLIHDYFFAKALDKVRSGGIIIFITSKGTMDKANPAVRRYLAERAELLGAIRLPDNTFKSAAGTEVTSLLGAIRLPDNTFKSAAGTEVTSDIIVLQKRERAIEVDVDWIHTATNDAGIAMNEYFVQHPEMILGEMEIQSTRSGLDSVCKASDTPLSFLLDNAVNSISKAQIIELTDEYVPTEKITEDTIPAPANTRNFSFVIVDGEIYYRKDNIATKQKFSGVRRERLLGLITLRDELRELIKYQVKDYSDEEINSKIKEVNGLYNDYVKAYGYITSRGNSVAFGDDESYYLLSSLEKIDDEGNFKGTADILKKRTIRPAVRIESVDTANEALLLSIAERATVDFEYMQSLTGKTKQEIIAELGNAIYKNPSSEVEEYLAESEYLSGNVREKLLEAERASQMDPTYNRNVEALRAVIPEDIASKSKRNNSCTR